MSRFVYDHPQEIGRHAAKLILEASNRALAKNLPFSIAISGGSVPSILRSGLDSLGCCSSASSCSSSSSSSSRDCCSDCNHWNVFLADERCVPRTHKDSNTSLIENILPMINTHGAILHTPSFEHIVAAQYSAVAIEYEKLLRKTVVCQDTSSTSTTPSLDVVVLGMGPDGHTCSLFPNSNGAKNSSDLNDNTTIAETKLVMAVIDSPKPPSERITLTYEALKAARLVIFICTGEEKASAIEQVFSIDCESMLPAALVTRNSVSRIGKENVVWLLDKSAAANL